jgi:hypothetical protein
MDAVIRGNVRAMDDGAILEPLFAIECGMAQQCEIRSFTATADSEMTGEHQRVV